MAEGSDLSLVSYARSHGLAMNHLSLDYHSLDSFPHTTVDWLDALPEDKSLPQLPTDVVNFNLKEKITVTSKDSFHHLSATSPTASHPPPPELEVDLRPTKRLRLESPLLSTDPELDVWKATKLFPAYVHDKIIPPLPVDEENDEGLSWPKQFQERHRDLDRQVQSEKIRIGKDAVLWLRDVVKPSASVRELEDCLVPDRPQRPSSITPPLMPCAKSSSPYLPSSSPARLELISDPTSLTEADLRDLERDILGDDFPKDAQEEANNKGLGPGDPLLFQLDSPQTSSGHVQQAYENLMDGYQQLKQAEPERLQLESPLLPPYLGPDNFEAACVSDPAEEIAKTLPFLPELSDELNIDDDTLFKNTFASASKVVENIISEEKLKSADSVLRLEVPALDSDLPRPPWHDTSRMAMMSLLDEIMSLHLSDKLWPGEIELARQLKWTPIPLEESKPPTECLADEEAALEVINLLTSSEDSPDTNILLGKKAGLRCSDHDDEEIKGEIAPAIFEKDTDAMPTLDQLLKDHRRGNVQDPGLSSREKSRDNEMGRSLVPKPDLVHGQGNDSEQTTNTSQVRSYRTLDTFIHLRGGPAKKVASIKISHYFNTPETPLLSEDASNKTLPEAVVEAVSIAPAKISPLPPIELPNSTSSPFILSSKLLNNLSLINRIKKTYPSAKLVERDFDSVSANDPLRDAQEADLILSPSTGLIWTSLSALAQKPLPGSALSENEVHQRIKLAIRRYERVVVLVSEGRAAAQRPVLPAATDDKDEGRAQWGSLSSDDALTLTEVMGLAIALKDDVQVLYVPGGEVELTNWIVRMMVQYGVHEKPVELLEDVTEWELFLRRAGFNAYAAQVIIDDLRVSCVELKNSELVCGLKAFVLMSRKQRLDRFERALGGRKVLDRVSDVLDAHRW